MRFIRSFTPKDWILLLIIISMVIIYTAKLIELRAENSELREIILEKTKQETILQQRLLEMDKQVKKFD